MDVSGYGDATRVVIEGIGLDEKSRMTCEITVDGSEIAEITSDGAFVIATGDGSAS